jgi:hypothetical protein
MFPAPIVRAVRESRAFRPVGPAPIPCRPDTVEIECDAERHDAQLILLAQ